MAMMVLRRSVGWKLKMPELFHSNPDTNSEYLKDANSEIFRPSQTSIFTTTASTINHHGSAQT
jgi:hypothetical protein